MRYSSLILVVVQPFIYMAITSLMILQCINLFGATPSLLKTSSSDIIIDTRKATVNDILGSVNVSSDSQAVKDLQYIKDVMTDLVNGGAKDDDFSVAAAFNINDFMARGFNSYRCWSTEFAGNYVKTHSSKNEACAMDQVLSCMGTYVNSDNVHDDNTTAYIINSDYLFKYTLLEEETVMNLTDRWQNVRDNVLSGTIFINVADDAYNELLKVSCSKKLRDTNNIQTVFQRITAGVYQNISRAPTSWKLGIAALVFQTLTWIAMFKIPLTLSFCFLTQLVSMALIAAMFGCNQGAIKSAAKKILASSSGLKVKATLYNRSGGNGALMIAILVLQVLLCVSLLYTFFLVRHLQNLIADTLRNLDDDTHAQNEAAVQGEKSHQLDTSTDDTHHDTTTSNNHHHHHDTSTNDNHHHHHHG